jgi:hypothetical protein
MKLKFSRQIFEKYSNIKFHENPSSGSRVFHADRQTDMTKLTVAFRNFAYERTQYRPDHHNAEDAFNGHLCPEVVDPNSIYINEPSPHLSKNVQSQGALGEIHYTRTE